METNTIQNGQWLSQNGVTAITPNQDDSYEYDFPNGWFGNPS